jgi:hypothetical protein
MLAARTNTRAEFVSVLFLALVVTLLGAYSFYEVFEASFVNDQNHPAGHLGGFSVSGFKVAGIQSIGTSDVILTVQFIISNPAPVSATLQNLVYKLYGDGALVGNGSISRPVVIRARAATTSQSDLEVGYNEAAKFGLSYLPMMSSPVLWDAVGNARIDNPSIGGDTILQFNCTDLSASISCNSNVTSV